MTAEGDQLTYAIQNWLSGEEAFSITFPLEQVQNPETYELNRNALDLMAEEARESLEADSKNLRTDFEQASQAPGVAVPPEVTPAVHLKEAEPMTEVRELVNQATVSVDVIRAGAEVDVPISARFHLTDETLESSGARPIEIDGTIKVITVTHEIPTTDPDYQRLWNIALPEEIDFTDTVSLLNMYGVHLSEKQYDPHGNRLVIFREVSRTGAVKESIQIHPPTPFAEQAGTEAEYVPVNIDLTEYGLGRLDGYFHQRIERPLAEIGEGRYRVYTTLEHEHAMNTYAPEFESISRGCTQAEQLFGVEPGELIDQIFIVNSRHPNAHYDPRDPYAIVFRDEIFQPEHKFNPEKTAIHEAGHLWHDSNGIENSKVLFDFHTQRSPAFFEALNETQFSEGDYHGGHSQDNVSEMLSSLVVSLLDEKWAERMQKSDPSFRKQYLALLLVYQIQLKAATTTRIAEAQSRSPGVTTPGGWPKRPVSDQAPIFQLLDERMRFLYELRKTQPSSAAPEEPIKGSL